MEATYAAAVKACRPRTAGRQSGWPPSSPVSWLPASGGDRVPRPTRPASGRGAPPSAPPTQRPTAASPSPPSPAPSSTWPPSSAPNLARAVHEAAVIHRVEPAEIEAVPSRRHNWAGRRELRAVLWGDVPVTLSHLESAFLKRLRKAGLPSPVPTSASTAGSSTAAGPRRASRSSSTATATTTPGTPGSGTGVGNARLGREGTSSAATRTATSSRGPKPMLRELTELLGGRKLAG